MRGFLVGVIDGKFRTRKVLIPIILEWADAMPKHVFKDVFKHVFKERTDNTDLFLQFNPKVTGELAVAICHVVCKAMEFPDMVA